MRKIYLSRPLHPSRERKRLTYTASLQHIGKAHMHNETGARNVQHFRAHSLLST